MPRRSKGPRLTWRAPKRNAKGWIVESGGWIIRDGSRSIRTGCGEDDRDGAERALADYIAQKHVDEARAQGPRHPDLIPIADAIALYLQDIAPSHARPWETTARANRLLDWWGERMLSEVTGQACRDYAANRGSKSAARRELEDLRAAIVYHHKEGHSATLTAVTLPEAAPRRERWLTVEEAAHLVRTAWRYREVQKGKPTGRYSRRHVARFILVALYTGSRAGAICQAALTPTPGHGWIDLESGMFYRRPEGERETKKRKPPIRIPDRLLVHIRRWHRLGISRRFVIEWNGSPVTRIAKAFARTADASGMPDVTPHTLRHTAATWMMQGGSDKWEACGYLGMSMETLENHYAHHHPDHSASARESLVRRKKPQAASTGLAQKERNIDRTLTAFDIGKPPKSAIKQ
ncbi:site-specific integrase [Amorphus sp. 3PC139-8]|uniref:site-specific integrase n=1 Tax=Amorphus sp. 3PC139-8 TaxID=2735676 RepID=UPI00345CEE4A